MFTKSPTKDPTDYFLFSEPISLEELALLTNLKTQGLVWVECVELTKSQGLADSVNALAAKALAIWPDWYDLALGPDLAQFRLPLDESSRARVINLAQANPGLNLQWLLKAIKMAQNGLSPILGEEFSLQGQIWQLSLALGSQIRVLAYRVSLESPARDFSGWGRALKEVSRIAKTELAVFLPKAFLSDPSLRPWAEKAQPLPQKKKKAGSSQPTPDNDSERAWEEKLAQSLAEDPALQAQYRRQVLVGRLENRPIRVNFLGPRLLAILVDEFQENLRLRPYLESSRLDFHLMTKGYRVLRISNQEIWRGLAAVNRQLSALARPMDKPRWIFPKYPDRGEPNPSQAAELELMELLELKPSLREKFYRNKAVSIDGQSVQPTLIWPNGLLAITIDQMERRQSLKSFLADRASDYLLTLAGFTHCRLTEVEILADPAKELKKIARLVNFKIKLAREL
ncbi:MAG: hypothetical protein LBR11_01295 [Deltaproteobacteria bacterium]|jgi:very-short-patch-repair endonuclease|nr:hypothetical protein [Deltaproteobacteria bacterium]